jgi:hypothetical protein
MLFHLSPAKKDVPVASVQVRELPTATAAASPAVRTDDVSLHDSDYVADMVAGDSFEQESQYHGVKV